MFLPSECETIVASQATREAHIVQSTRTLLYSAPRIYIFTSFRWRSSTPQKMYKSFHHFVDSKRGDSRKRNTKIKMWHRTYCHLSYGASVPSAISLRKTGHGTVRFIIWKNNTKRPTALAMMRNEHETTDYAHTRTSDTNKNDGKEIGMCRVPSVRLAT